MSQEFEIKPIRRVASDGSLEAVGLEWAEEASWRNSKRIALVFIVPLIAVLLGFGLFTLFIGGVGLMFLGLGIWAVWWLRRYMWGPLPRRSVVLVRSGTIETPHGVPGEPAQRALRMTQPDIAGFEVGPSHSGTPNDWTSTIKIVGLDGTTRTISRLLHAEEAREVAVKLNLALKDMRAVATRPVQRVAPHAASLLVD